MAGNPAPPSLLTAHLEEIEAALRAALPRDDSQLAHAARYVMGWEDERYGPSSAAGKRIRPALCIFGARVFDGPPVAAMPGAVAVELVHNFSLVHDEVQDRDAERHHRPTLWAMLGEAQAINAGDYLYSRAVRALAEGHGPAERRLAALTVLNEAIERMIAGQWADIGFESRDSITSDEYLAMVEGKTGALLGAPLEMGALLAGAEREEAAILGEWGRKVGLAFQAQDDYLGVWGDPSQTGKSNENDLARRKKSLPVVLALEHPRAGPALKRVFEGGPPSSEEVASLTHTLDEAGVRFTCREVAIRFAAEADAVLDGLAVEAVRADFRAIADYLVGRQS